MLRKTLLGFAAAVALLSGWTVQSAQAAEWCGRPNFCQEKRTNCRWGCAPLSGAEWSNCMEACDRVYTRCCSNGVAAFLDSSEPETPAALNLGQVEGAPEVCAGR